MGVSVTGVAQPTFAVRLIDRRTGAAHRINGRALVMFTRRPQDAAAELLQGRDAAVWEARAEALPFGGDSGTRS